MASKHSGCRGKLVILCSKYLMSVLKMKRWKNVLEKQIRMWPKTNPILMWCNSMWSSSRTNTAVVADGCCPASSVSTDQGALWENDPYTVPNIDTENQQSPIFYRENV